MNSLDFRHDVIELKTIFSLRTVPSINGYKISLERVSTDTHVNLINLTNGTKQGPARYFMVYVGDKISNNKLLLLPADLKILIFKSETVFSGCIISLKDYDHDKSFLKKSWFWSALQGNNFLSQKFSRAKSSTLTSMLIRQGKLIKWRGGTCQKRHVR